MAAQVKKKSSGCFQFKKNSAPRDMKFCTILPLAKIGSLVASAIDNINSSTQGEMALKVLICGKYATFCGKP